MQEHKIGDLLIGFEGLEGKKILGIIRKINMRRGYFVEWYDGKVTTEWYQQPTIEMHSKAYERYMRSQKKNAKP